MECCDVKMCHGGVLGQVRTDTTGYQKPWDLLRYSEQVVRGGGFAKDGLHLNGRGKRRLGKIYARIIGLDFGSSAGSKM